MSDPKDTMNEILKEQERRSEQPPPPESYWDVWRQKRKNGMWLNMFVTFAQCFLLSLFVRMCYLFAVRDFHFAVGWQEFVVSAGVALLFWFGREHLFKRYEARRQENTDSRDLPKKK